MCRWWGQRSEPLWGPCTTSRCVRNLQPLHVQAIDFNVWEESADGVSNRKKRYSSWFSDAQHMQDATKNLTELIAQISYYLCHLLVRSNLYYCCFVYQPSQNAISTECFQSNYHCWKMQACLFAWQFFPCVESAFVCPASQYIAPCPVIYRCTSTWWMLLETATS